MLPSPETLIEEIGHRAGIRTRQLARYLEIEDTDFDQLVELLMDMQKKGFLVRVPGQGWNVLESSDYRVGIIRMSRQGYAFINLPRDENAGDIFVPAKATGGAFDGDLVVAELRPSRNGKRGRPLRSEEKRLREGRVVEIVERRKALVRGKYWVSKNHGKSRSKKRSSIGFVEPIGKVSQDEIYIPPGKGSGVRDGQKVLVRLLNEPGFGVHPSGEVVHVIEDEGSPESDFKVLVAEYGFPVSHSQAVLEEAKRLPETFDEDDLKEREDLRHLLTFTIDPDDAQDHDDAISLEMLPNECYRLGVHIADVSYFVRPESSLDACARDRGTSIYFPGKVVPMLPERISNKLASLKPDEDRLTKSVFIDIDTRGQILETRVVRSVIRSKRRFTYAEVLGILENKKDCEGFSDTLGRMAQLRNILHEQRIERGCLELSIPSLRLVVDPETEETVNVVSQHQDASHQMIEEFMLAANEGVARYMSGLDLPLVYRVHDKPDEDALEDFFDFLEKISCRFGRKRRGKDLQKLLKEIQGEPYASIVNMNLLRSLPHAEYSSSQRSHFALATAGYCHFTSPIRRYPDLLVHQILDEYWDGKLTKTTRKSHWVENLPELAAESCKTERRAEDAERDMIRLRLTRYLQDRVGEEMEGMIVAIHTFGFFVQEKNQLLDGLVHISTLVDDYYEHDSENYSLRGRRKSKQFNLGDKVRVILAELNPDFREIRFQYVGSASQEDSD